MSESNLQAVAMEVAKRLAQKVFAGDPDREAKVADAVSLAWEFSQGEPQATPGNVAYYAVCHAKVGRQFQQSSRSIDGPNPRKRQKPERSGIDPGDLARPGEDPAVIAAVRMDLETWWAGLTDRQRAMAACLAQGHTTEDVAKRFRCTPGNVSQFRRRLAQSWQALQV